MNETDSAQEMTEMTENPLLWQEAGQNRQQDLMDEADIERSIEEAAIIVGLFTSLENALQAIDALEKASFSNEELNVISQEATIKAYVSGKESQVVAGHAGAGVVGGTAIGGLAGLFVGASAIMLPGLGPILAAGTLASTVLTTATGAGVGAALGGLVGALAGLGLSKQDAELYATSLKQGGLLIAVETRADKAHKAISLMHQARPLDVTVRHEKQISSSVSQATVDPSN